MRLTCPNCNAQYEVDASVIPDAGRDVQCSSCGHSWFQTPEATQAAPPSAQAPLPEGDDRQGDPETSSPEIPAESENEPTPEISATQPVIETPPADSETTAAADDDGDDDIERALSVMVSASREEEDHDPAEALADDTASPAPSSATPRRPQDDSLLSILREEAEREASARRAEGSALETQPDLGLDDAAAGAAGAAGAALTAKAAKAEPETLLVDEFEDEEIDDEIPEQAVRRRALPDIEEINSSLSATSDRGSEPAALDAPQTLARRRSGFRVGFTLILLVAAAGLLVYSMAASIGNAVPALAPTLDAYVQKVDEGRVWLDQQMRDVIDALQDDSQV